MLSAKYIFSQMNEERGYHLVVFKTVSLMENVYWI
jgi:hypothetical protein